MGKEHDEFVNWLHTDFKNWVDYIPEIWNGWHRTQMIRAGIKPTPNTETE